MLSRFIDLEAEAVSELMFLLNAVIGGNAMQTRYFEFIDGKSSKFWEASIEGNTVTTRWGRIGTNGQTKTIALDTEEKARTEYDKLVAQKVKKGYVETSETDRNAIVQESSASWERVFIRDVKEATRLDTRTLSSRVEIPIWMDSDDKGESLESLPDNSRRWLLGVHLGDQKWVSFLSNSLSGKELFDSSSRYRCLDAVYVGYESTKRGWFFRFKRSGKRVTDFELSVRNANKFNKAKFMSTELADHFLDGCVSGQNAIDKLCQFYDIDRDACQLAQTSGTVQLVDADGQSVLHLVRGYFLAATCGIEERDDQAADMLAEGIELLDAERIRQAVLDGASPDALAGRQVKPIDAALHECPKPRAVQCVKTLVALGVPIDGTVDEPSVVKHASHLGSEEKAIAKLSVLLSLGANVNAVNSRSGNTALFENVMHRRMGVVECLMRYGANPMIRNNAGESVIDWLQQRIVMSPSSEAPVESRRASPGFLPHASTVLSEEWQRLFDLVSGWPSESELLRRSGTADESRHEVDPDLSLYVRQCIASLTRATVDQLTPETNLAGECGISFEQLMMYYAVFNNEFEIDVKPVLQEVGALSEFDDEGYLTDDSRRRLNEVLPNFHLGGRSDLTEDDVLLSVAAVEAVVAAAIARCAVDELSVSTDEDSSSSDDESMQSESEERDWLQMLPPSIRMGFEYTLTGQRAAPEWDRQLIEGLDDRKQRLLLAGSLRYVFRTIGKRRDKWELNDALDALEVFADTKKTKTALRNAQQTLRNQLMHTRKRWRNPVEYTALEKSLEYDDPTDAVPFIIHVISQIHGITEAEAADRFAKLREDLVAPSSVSSHFPSELCSKQVEELARSMYESRDFSEMPQLADALKQAGCDEEVILDHCRNPERTHMRGCWVVDAILDSGRAVPVKSPKKRKKSPLSRYPKGAQYAIKEIIDRCYVDYTFEGYLAKRWDVEGHWQVVAGVDSKQRVDRMRARLSQAYSHFSANQIDTLLSIGEIMNDLRNACIARRVVREEPSELGRGLSVLHRLGQVIPKHGRGRNGFQNWLEACSVREFEIAPEIAKAYSTDSDLQGLDDWGVCDRAIVSILSKNSKVLESATAEMTKRKVAPWLNAIQVVLRGIAERQPRLVADGLQDLLERIRRMRQKDDFDSVINLNAQGLYRLSEWVDPQLVAEFDVKQAYPWDSEFHAWCDDHPDALQEVNLHVVSPELHEIVIDRNPPQWLVSLEVQR